RGRGTGAPVAAGRPAEMVAHLLGPTAADARSIPRGGVAASAPHAGRGTSTNVHASSRDTGLRAAGCPAVPAAHTCILSTGQVVVPARDARHIAGGAVPCATGNRRTPAGGLVVLPSDDTRAG